MILEKHSYKGVKVIFIASGSAISIIGKGRPIEQYFLDHVFWFDTVLSESINFDEVSRSKRILVFVDSIPGLQSLEASDSLKDAQLPQGFSRQFVQLSNGLLDVIVKIAD